MGTRMVLGLARVSLGQGHGGGLVDGRHAALAGNLAGASDWETCEGGTEEYFEKKEEARR